MGPHNSGCGTCTGLITVHNGDGPSGQFDYIIKYYDMGQLTKFVKPGAYRVDSTANSSVTKRRVAEPRRLQGTRRLPRVRVHPNADRQLGRRALLILPARADVRDLHLERFAGYGRRSSHRPDHGLRRQVRCRSLTATAPPLRAGRSRPAARCRPSASAWTSPREAPRTQRRSSSTTATGRVLRSGSTRATAACSTPTPVAASTPPDPAPPTEPAYRSGTERDPRTNSGPPQLTPCKPRQLQSTP